MNEEKARQELTRLKSPDFSLRLGILCGVTITLAILGLSYIEPHLDFIITTSRSFMFGVSIYIIHLTYRLNKIYSILHSSEKTEETEG